MSVHDDLLQMEREDRAARDERRFNNDVHVLRFEMLRIAHRLGSEHEAFDHLLKAAFLLKDQ